MNRRIKIPYIVDILLTDEPEGIRTLNDDDRIDRGFKRRGPLVNRIIQGRLIKAMSLGAWLLPAFMPRDDDERAQAQRALDLRLDDGLPWHADDLEDVVALIKAGSTHDEVGIAVQKLVGRLFFDDYQADAESYEAAKLVDAYLRTNPLKALWWKLSGKLRRAKKLLWERAHQDGHAIHATVIAFHNLVVAIERMRALRENAGRRPRLSAETIVQQCLSAPPRLLRRVKAPIDTPLSKKPLKAHGLVVFEQKTAQARSGAIGDAFMRDSWSQCPAHELVPALLLAIWNQLEPKELAADPVDAAAGEVADEVPA